MGDEEEVEEQPLQGFNEQEYPDGSKYAGNFVDGMRHGEGELTWENKCRYKGEWKDGSRHGPGKFYWTNGSGYEGFWECGKQTGKGKYFWDDVVTTEDGCEERTTKMCQDVIYEQLPEADGGDDRTEMPMQPIETSHQVEG